jgi:hypothetical protein
MNRAQREGWHAPEQQACHREGVRVHRAVGLLFFLLIPLASFGADGSKPYEVRDGNKVDTKTLNGWKTWRALACERCHGAEQEGLVGPSLIESMKRLSKEEFYNTLMNGRIDKGMPAFNTSQMVKENWEGLYAYLKGRSDGAIKPGRLSALNE